MIQPAKIIVDSLELFAFHGCYAHEQEFGQHFLLDLEITLDISEAARNDQLSDALNYAAVITAVRHFFCERRYNLLETAATIVAQGILEQFHTIQSLTVRVKKTTPPLADRLGYVAVELTLNRAQLNA